MPIPCRQLPQLGICLPKAGTLQVCSLTLQRQGRERRAELAVGFSTRFASPSCRRSRPECALFGRTRQRSVTARLRSRCRWPGRTGPTALAHAPSSLLKRRALWCSRGCKDAAQVKAAGQGGGPHPYCHCVRGQVSTAASTGSLRTPPQHSTFAEPPHRCRLPAGVSPRSASRNARRAAPSSRLVSRGREAFALDSSGKGPAPSDTERPTPQLTRRALPSLCREAVH